MSRPRNEGGSSWVAEIPLTDDEFAELEKAVELGGRIPFFKSRFPKTLLLKVRRAKAISTGRLPARPGDPDCLAAKGIDHAPQC